MDGALSGATNPGQSEPGSDGNKEMLCIRQSSNIAGTSPSDFLVSYIQNTRWVGVVSSCTRVLMCVCMCACVCVLDLHMIIYLWVILHIYIYIYIYIIYIYIYTYIYIKHNRHFMSTYFLLDPFEFPYYFYCILGELIYVLSIVACIPSTFCPTLGHHQGRIYYKSDVTFVLAYYNCVRASLPLKVFGVCF